MESLGGKTLQTPALGRPINLGMLYDCREDSLIPDGKQPPVLEAINASGVPCPGPSGSDSDGNFDEMFWQMGTKSMQKFFTNLCQMETKMTKEVLKERKQLVNAVMGLQPQIRAGLAKLQEIKTTKEKIKEHETVMTLNKNFGCDGEIFHVQFPLSNKDENVTNCKDCHRTCHHPCAIKEDDKKDGCTAMDSTGKCTVCPGKCHWKVHKNQTYMWVPKDPKDPNKTVPMQGNSSKALKEKLSFQELIERQEESVPEMQDIISKALKEKLSFQELIERQEEEIENLQDVIMSLIEQSAVSLTRLNEIALRPNPLTTPGYIDMLIEGETSEAKPGYQARIQALEAMRDKARIISRVARKDKVKDEAQVQCEEQQPQPDKEKKKGFWERFFELF